MLVENTIGGDVVRRQQSVGEMKTRPLLDDHEPVSVGGGAKERRAAPLSLACPKTLACLITQQSCQSSFNYIERHGVVAPDASPVG